MIIQPARIVIIDNEEAHLKSMVDALSEMGSACLPFHYKEEHPKPELLAGARFIFSDLHLVSDAVTSDKKQQYANIASMLLSCLDENHGPYVLVIWSEFPDELSELIKYFDDLEPNQRPIKCCVLNKNDYIPTVTDPSSKTGDLVSAVAHLLNDIPGLSALLKWEQKVSAAASITTSTLWKLSEGHDENERDLALRNTLGRLAKGASGDSAARQYPGRGVMEALTPLLSDQLEKSEIDEEFWKSAVSFDAPERAASGASLYTMLYFENPTGHSALERGTVCTLPEEWASEEKFNEKFGYRKSNLIEEFGYKGEKKDEAEKRAEWCLVQLNAACDQAQGNPGFYPFVLGCIIPSEIKCNSPKGSVFRSRTVVLDGIERQLYCHGRFVLTMTMADAKNIKVKMRIRTQLLDQMMQDIRTKSARLGTIEPY